jgi:hypothetical protein
MYDDQKFILDFDHSINSELISTIDLAIEFGVF